MSRMPEPRELDPAAAGLIRASLTGDKFATDRILTRAFEADLDGLFFAFTVANLAGRVLAQACGSEAQAVALVDSWINALVRERARAAALQLDLGFVPGFGLLTGFGLGSGLPARSARRIRCWPAVRLAAPRRAGRPGRPVLAVRPAAPPGRLARAASSGLVSGSGLGADGGSGSGARWGGQGSPASMAAWCWRAMARSTAWMSASNSRHHPAFVCGSSLGCGCGSSSGWACPRRWSSALAFPAVSLLAWVSADHCSYRALPASSRCRSAAICSGEGAGAGRAGVVVLGLGIGGLREGVGFGLRSEPQLACSRPAGRWPGRVRRRGPGLRVRRGSGRG